VKRLAIIAAIVAMLGAGANAPSSTATQVEASFNRTIYVVNQSSTVSDETVANDLPAFQAGLTDFEKYWGGSIKLVQVDAIPYRAWGITITDNPGCTQCLGYHDVRGVPFAIVGTPKGYNWTVTFTHELFEMAADPFIRRTDEVNGVFWLVEVGDPVEASAFAYTRSAGDGTPVKISDFVTDLWYRKGVTGKLDFANHVHKSLHLLAGGYASYWGYADGRSGWQQVFATNPYSPKR
jgi:hypothetical protein